MIVFHPGSLEKHAIKGIKVGILLTGSFHLETSGNCSVCGYVFGFLHKYMDFFLHNYLPTEVKLSLTS